MICALILAAGESKRMGKPKMLLPWGTGTVLQQVVSVFQEAGVQDILVVTGAVREQVEAHLAGEANLRTVFNPDYAGAAMLSSIQCGLASMGPETRATLICLGDQPQVQVGSVRAILQEYAAKGASLIVPSYQMRRGHPWLVARPLWDEVLRMEPPRTARDLMNKHSATIEYVEVDTPSVIQDLDTPDDYRKYGPGSG